MSAAAEAASSGVVTILITDAEGLTRRWENDADEMCLTLPSMSGHAGGPE